MRRNPLQEEFSDSQFLHLLFVLLSKPMFWQEISLPECCWHLITDTSASSQGFLHLNLKSFLSTKMPNYLSSEVTKPPYWISYLTDSIYKISRFQVLLTTIHSFFAAPQTSPKPEKLMYLFD